MLIATPHLQLSYVEWIVQWPENLGNYKSLSMKLLSSVGETRGFDLMTVRMNNIVTLYLHPIIICVHPLSL